MNPKWILISLVATSIVFGVVAGTSQVPQKQVADPVVNLKLTLPQASSIVYTIRYTTVLDAKTANELADLVINQINDTTLNKQLKQLPAPRKN